MFDIALSRSAGTAITWHGSAVYSMGEDVAAGAAGQLHQLGHRAQLGRVRPFDVDRLQVQRVQLPTQLTR